MWILYLLSALLLIAVLLFFFSILPRRRRNCSPFDKVWYAHRGLHEKNGTVPENSLAALQLADSSGFGVEFDIRFTADRQIVVFHDDDLNRMCGVNRRVDELTYEELCSLRLQNGDQRIPLLTEVLETLENAPIVCELKAARSYTDTSLCEAALPILESYKGKYCIESFNPLMVRWFKIHAPHVIRGFLSKRFTEEDKLSPILSTVLSSLLTNALCRPDFIAYQHTDWKHPAFRLCKLFNPMTVAWTVTNQADADVADKVFDTVIFEGFIPKTTEK